MVPYWFDADSQPGAGSCGGGEETADSDTEEATTEETADSGEEEQK